MARKSVWDKIKAAFLAGTPITAIAKQFRVSIAEILQRAAKEGWRDKEPPKMATVTSIVPYAAPAPPPPDPARIAQDDIIREHRERTRTQRDLYDKLLAEFQAMLGHLVSFLDPVMLKTIQETQEPDKRIALLSALLKATAVKFTMFERLNMMLREIVGVERLVWGLDADKNPEDNTTAWEVLLAQVRAPAVIPAMPAHVINFEERLKRAEERSSQQGNRHETDGS